MPPRKSHDEDNLDDELSEEELEGSTFDSETDIEGQDGDESGEDDDQVGEDEDEDGDEDEVDGSDDGGDDDPAPLTVTGRISQMFGLPAKTRAPRREPAAVAKMSDKQKADAIRQVDQLERRIGFGGAVLAMVIGLVAFVPYIRDPSKRVADQIARIGKHCPKGFKGVLVKGAHQCSGTVTFARSHWVLELAIVVFFGAFIAVATWYGRRSLVAFALMFGGLAVVSTTGSILGILYVGAGGWLMVRAYRVQKYGTTSAKEVQAVVAEQRAERKASKTAGGSTSGGGGRSTSRTRAARGAKAAKDTKAATADGKSRPQANKRYTPKTPPRKRPVPPST